MDTVERIESASTESAYDGFISYSHAADGLLAPRLQAGLQRFAKPWWRRRALRVFRDESSLSANPHLWSSITDALDSSAWFVLLLSPDAAASQWVNQEIDYWKTHRDSSRILPVVTDGDFGWDGSDVSGSAVPESLRNVFSEEPRWVDLRFARDEEQLDLKDPRFADAVADIASALRGVPKDELASEEVRQHRRTIRTAWAAVGLVAILAITAVGFALEAGRERVRAEEEAIRANSEADRAEEEADRAAANAAAETEARADAETSAAEAVRAAAVARSRELYSAAASVLDRDPELSILLTLAAVEAAPGSETLPIEALDVLRQAMAADHLHTRHRLSDTAGSVTGRISRDGSLGALVSSDEGTLSLVELDAGATRWVYTDPATHDSFNAADISPDGSLVVLSIHDHRAGGDHGHDDEHAADDSHDDEGSAADATGDGFFARLVILDSRDGSVLQVVRSGECDNSAQVRHDPAFSPDGSLFAVYSGRPDCGDGDPRSDWVDLYDTETWAPVARHDVGWSDSLDWAEDAGLALVVGFGEPARVVDVVTGRTVRAVDRPNGAISPDGGLLAMKEAGTHATPIELIEVATGEVVDRLRGLESSAGDAVTFSPDGSMVVAGTFGGEVGIWDVATGEMLEMLHAPLGAGISFSDDGERMLTGHFGREVLEWRFGASSSASTFAIERDGATLEIDPFLAPGTTVIRSFDPLGLVGPLAVVAGRVDGTDALVAVDARSGEPVATLDAGSFAVIDESAVVAAVTADKGSVVIWEPAAGATAEVRDCRSEVAATPCPDFAAVAVAVSADGAMVGGVDGDDILRVWDRASGRHVGDTVLPVPVDGVLAITGEWALVDPARDNRFLQVALGTGEIISEVAPGDAPQALAALADGYALGSGTGDVRILDQDLMEVDRWDAHAGIVTAVVPDGENRLATVGGDGFIRIWSLDTHQELHRVPVRAAVDAVWVDDQTLGVLSTDGTWSLETIDLDVLLDRARAATSRGLTAEECRLYGFEDCQGAATPDH